MNIKEKILKQIDEFDSRYFNDDQKSIAIKIIENANENEVKDMYDFITYKRRVGFGFDYSPETAKGRIIKTIKREDLSIGKSENSNTLLIGENYNALKILNVTHKNSIDVIYIDPPYNTEKAKTDGNQSSKSGKASKFLYKDKFGRTGWLNLMNERLQLARELLSERGVIFVSIDDNEQAYLKVLMDQIFGESSFVSTFIWRKKTSGARKESVAGRHEYIHCYTKSKNKEIFKVNKYDKEDFDYFEEDGRGYNLENLQRGTSSTTPYEIIDDEGNKYFPKEGSTWRWNEVKLKKEWNRVVFANGNVYTKTYEKGGKWPHTLLTDSFYGSSRSGREWLEKLIGKSEFDTVKPVNLIKMLISIASEDDSIILDFFAGSGTTAESVFELNKEDGGKRKVILCTNNENEIAEKITFNRLKKIIEQTYNDEALNTFILDDKKTIEVNEDVDEEFQVNLMRDLKEINPNYNPSKLSYYYDLAALNPLKSEEE